MGVALCAHNRNYYDKLPDSGARLLIVPTHGAGVHTVSFDDSAPLAAIRRAITGAPIGKADIDTKMK